MTGALPNRSIFLIGFMASGKTTVGRELASLLDQPFLDLDDVIEAAVGQPVRDIFAEQGEHHFRRVERAALTEAIEGPASVVATGGGAPCFENGIELMREGGLVIALTAPLEHLLDRLDDTGTRPLLEQPAAEVRALYESRLAIYRQAHVSVRTEDRSPEQVACVIYDIAAAAEAIPAYALTEASIVALGDRSYPVVVAPGSLGRVGELGWRMLGPRCQKVGIVSDSNVAPLYANRVVESFRSEGLEPVEVIIDAGEASKSFDVFRRVTEELVAAGLDRSSAIVALGGGVVGDLAGYVAASLYRGVSYIQVPTTLLAMVDSAIGGKTGINLKAGKNLVGAFWQPTFVLADPETLTTLPVRERRAAFGELVKYALLDGEELFGLIDQIAPTLQRDGGALPQELTEVIRRCAGIKSWIVTRDEREQTGERALLNLGHTVGHAIEAATDYVTFLHGEAVAIGLVAACRLSARLGLCKPELEEQVAGTLRRAGLDVDLDPWLRDDVLHRIGVDKKRTGSRIRFVTVSAIGAASLTELDVSEVIRILRS